MNDGAGLLRRRPLAVAGTVLLTVALAVAYNWAWIRLLPSYGPMPSTGPLDALMRYLVLPLLRVLPVVAPLIAIAALSGRRVTARGALLLWGAAALLEFLGSMAFEAVIDLLPRDLSSTWVVPLATAVTLLVLIGTGVLARWFLPAPGRPAVGGGDLPAPVVASLVAAVAMLPASYLGLWGSTVWWAVVNAAWAVAALVTSAPEASEWSAEPAELGFQDP